MNRRCLYAGIVTFIVIFFACFTYIYAHSGRTDGNGGHYDNSTGEYHYHHGYPAHSHNNGVCPYDYKYADNNKYANRIDSGIADSEPVNKKSTHNDFFEGLFNIIICIAVLFIPWLIVQTIKFVLKIIGKIMRL